MSDDNTNVVSQIIDEDPRMSLPAEAHRLSLPKTSVHKILKVNLRKKSYSLQVLHNLHEAKISAMMSLEDCVCVLLH